MEIMIIVLGLLLGSFLNICIDRIPRNQPILGETIRCMGCGGRLRLVDRMPVLSYVFFGGRCRHCRRRIPPRYLLIELLTAFAYLLLFCKYGYCVEFIAGAFLLALLIIVFFVDYDFMIIPDQLVLIGLMGGGLLFAYNLFLPVSFYGDRHWWTPALGAIAGSGFLFVIAKVASYIFKAKDAMGGGDIKIWVPIGMFLGWKLMIAALFLSVVLAGLVSFILVIFKVIDKKSSIPFGPFIVTGTFITLLWGWGIIRWYLHL